MARQLQKRKCCRQLAASSVVGAWTISIRDILQKGRIMNVILKCSLPRSATGVSRRADKYLAAHYLQPPRMKIKKSLEELLLPFFTEYKRMKLEAMTVDPVQIANTPKVHLSTFAHPWKVVTVSDDEISKFINMDENDFDSNGVYNIGPARSVSNTNPFDLPSACPSIQIKSKKPGEGVFTNVTTGPYGQREFKYLYLIDHSGMHIVREMTPCPESSRGIPMHSLIKSHGVVGGEIFFDDDNPKVAYINFGSARLTFRDAAEADRTARFVLSLGYEKIIAVYPDRDFSINPYGMKDRYGESPAHVVYVKGSL